jgi:FkbM family methyltransferase
MKRTLPDNLVYRYQMWRTCGREPLLRLLRPMVSKGTVVDVGANLGVYTWGLGRWAQRVVAFEPVPQLADSLRRFNPRAEVYNCALSDCDGELTLYIPSHNGVPVLTRCSLNPDANPGFEIRSQTVPVHRLDEFCLSSVTVLKVDVEGHERRALAGAEETITRCRPVLVVEIEERHHPGQSHDIITWIENLGYATKYFDEGCLHDLDQFDFSVAQLTDSGRQPCETAPGNYINNFVFLPT